MFGFGGGFNGPGGGSTNSGSAPSGKAKSSGDPRGMDSRGGGSTPSPNTSGSSSSKASSKSSSSAGREGTGGGPGGPAGTGRNSGANAGRESNAGREGTTSGPGNPGASRAAPDAARFGGTPSSAGGIDPARFGTPSAANVNPDRFGPTRGFSVAGPVTPSLVGPAIPANTFRAAEDASMAALTKARTVDSYQLAADNMQQVGIGNVAGKVVPNAAFLGPIVDKMIGVESNNNPKAKNPLSSATGLGQFISRTWSNMVDKYRPDLANLSVREKLALRTDPKLAREMTTNYATENALHLAKNGVTVTPESVYAAHFLGPDGAVRAYKANKANPQTPAVNVFGAKAVNANASIMKGRTVGQVLGYINEHMEMDAPKTVTDHKTFGDKYLGGSAEEDYFGSKPDHNWPGNNEMAAANPETYGTPAQPETQIGPPNGDLSKFPPAPEERTQKRSITGSLIAGGIDVLGTLVPGAGPYIGMANAGLALTGNRTIGEFMSDSIMNGDNTYQPGSATGNSGSRADRYVPEPAPITKPGATVKTPAFADKYLTETAYFDPVARPTPAQKWGEGSATYGESEYA